MGPSNASKHAFLAAISMSFNGLSNCIQERYLWFITPTDVGCLAYTDMSQYFYAFGTIICH